jgi:putative Holliday junction resolvase
VAISDGLQLTAQPHGTLDARDPELDRRLGDLAVEHDAAEIVVGLAIGLDGREGPAAAAARAFAERVEQATGVPVVLYDERFSSVTAERVLVDGGVRRRARRAARDRVAAAVFLQAYLDGRR